VRTEHERSARRYVCKVFDKDGTLAAQVVDDKLVVDDFVSHVNRPAVFLKRALNDFDGTINAGTESARIGQQDFSFTHLATLSIVDLLKPRHWRASSGKNAR
jgi:hypothetical protein